VECGLKPVPPRRAAPLSVIDRRRAAAADRKHTARAAAGKTASA